MGRASWCKLSLTARFIAAFNYNGISLSNYACLHYVISLSSFSYADGSSYEGAYAGGVRHGHGTFKFANGDKYRP